MKSVLMNLVQLTHPHCHSHFQKSTKKDTWTKTWTKTIYHTYFSLIFHKLLLPFFPVTPDFSLCFLFGSLQLLCLAWEKKQQPYKKTISSDTNFNMNLANFIIISVQCICPVATVVTVVCQTFLLVAGQK